MLLGDYNYVLGNPIKWVDEDGKSPGDPKKQKQTNKGKLDQPDRLANDLRTLSDVKLWLAMRVVEMIIPSGSGSEVREKQGPVQEQRGSGEFFVLTSKKGSGSTNQFEPKPSQGSDLKTANIDNLVAPKSTLKSGVSLVDNIKNGFSTIKKVGY